jgi:hypothetical protein
MFQLNIKAVDARYGNGEAEKFRKLNYRYQIIMPVPLMQVLKSLQCWLYQCCEGDVPETELYGLFDTDIQMDLMGKIIGILPEYQNAVWGQDIVSCQDGQTLATQQRNAMCLTGLWMRNTL